MLINKFNSLLQLLVHVVEQVRNVFFMCCTGSESLYNTHGAEKQYEVFFVTKAFSHCSGLDAKMHYTFRLQSLVAFE